MIVTITDEFIEEVKSKSFFFIGSYYFCRDSNFSFYHLQFLVSFCEISEELLNDKDFDPYFITILRTKLSSNPQPNDSTMLNSYFDNYALNEKFHNFLYKLLKGGFTLNCREFEKRTTFLNSDKENILNKFMTIHTDIDGNKIYPDLSNKYLPTLKSIRNHKMNYLL